MIGQANKLAQWAFFFRYADRYTADRLKELLEGVEFEQAISVLDTIVHKTEDRMMYDQREKAQRDHEWLLQGAHERGREEGREEGLLAGKIQVLQQILGESVHPTESLLANSRFELDRLLSDLQLRLQSRDA